MKKDKKTMLNEYNLTDDLRLVASNDKDLIEFAEKWENFMMETIKKANELHIEGSNLQAADIFSLPPSRERNRFVLARLGSLKHLVKILNAVYEQARKET